MKQPCVLILLSRAPQCPVPRSGSEDLLAHAPAEVGLVPRDSNEAAVLHICSALEACIGLRLER